MRNARAVRAGRSYPTPKGRSGGREELPHVQVQERKP